MSARLIMFCWLIGIACPVWAATEPTPAAVFASTMTRDVSKLRLASANVLVFDTKSGHSIYAKGADTITPIASVTKLMTAMVVLDANQALDETISVGIADLDLLKGTIRACDWAAICRARDAAPRSDARRSRSVEPCHALSASTTLRAAMNRKAKASAGPALRAPPACRRNCRLRATCRMVGLLRSTT